MSITLRTVRVAPRDAVVPPIATPFPPVPRTAAEAEPYEPAPDPTPTTTSHGAHRLRGWMARLRNRLIQWRGEAIREAWANGYRGGRTVERTEIADHIRGELEAGHYDYRDGNGAVREILRRLEERSPTRNVRGGNQWQTPIR